MKNKPLGIVITFLLLIIAFSGCSEDNKANNQSDELDRFAGTWYGTYGMVYLENQTWIFYENRSLKIIEEEFDTVRWGEYSLDNTQLKTKMIGTYWYDYVFSDNDASLYLEGEHGFNGNFTKQ